MVGANVKAETLALMEQRTAIETEMDVIIERLCPPGGPGLSGNLVDEEGFPRADINIPAVRADRQKLAVLKNDHKEITAKIEKNIYVLHSGGSTLPLKRTAEGEEVTHQRRVIQSRPEPSSIPEAEAVAMDEDKLNRIPFAVFDEVTEGSPAARGGILVGDELLKFGNVEGGDDTLPRLAREGQANEGRAISVVVLRRGVQVQLTVTPMRWAGNGLLGCHIQPI